MGTRVLKKTNRNNTDLCYLFVLRIFLIIILSANSNIESRMRSSVILIPVQLEITANFTSRFLQVYRI